MLVASAKYSVKLNVRLHCTQSNAKQRLVAFTGGRLRHLLKIDQPLFISLVLVELSNRSQSLRSIATST